MTCDILKIKVVSMAVAETQLNITIPPVTLTNGQVFRLCYCPQQIPANAGVTQVYLVNGSTTIPVFQPSCMSGNYAHADQLRCSTSLLMVYGNNPVHASILCRVKPTCFSVAFPSGVQTATAAVAATEPTTKAAKA